MAWAVEQAVEFLRMEEWPEDDGGLQVAAFKEVANRIERRSAQIVNWPKKVAPNGKD